MLKQSLSQRLQQKLSPQQIQLMKLIQLPTQALEERIQEEMEINPALEEGNEEQETADELSNEWEEEGAKELEYDPMDDYLSDDDVPDYKLQANNYSVDDESFESPIVVGKDMSDLLQEQLSMRSISPQKEALCKYLIGTLEDDGYLRRELADIVDDLAFSLGIFIEVTELEEALKIIQSMEPAGVGGTGFERMPHVTVKTKAADPADPSLYSYCGRSL